MVTQQKTKLFRVVTAVVFLLLSLGVIYNAKQSYDFYLEIAGQVTPATEADVKLAILSAVLTSLHIVVYLSMAVLLLVTQKPRLYLIPAAAFVLWYVYCLGLKVYSIVSIFDMMQKHKELMYSQIAGFIAAMALVLVAIAVLIYVICCVTGRKMQVANVILMASLALAVVLILVSLRLTIDSEELGTRYSQNIYVGHLTLTVKALAMLPVACAVRLFQSEGRAEESVEVDVV